MRKLDVSDLELTVLNKGLAQYHAYLESKIEELNECSSHFFVNEGLMNEVRIEKEKLQKELVTLNTLQKKCSEVEDE